ncbi:MAG: aminotransferase class III-fold pyridoxal phosphate-dependent enzyme [Saprospiraceae bacterium]
MVFSTIQIQQLAREHFGLEVSVKPLPGEIDLNFYVQTPTGAAYTLKIANAAEPRENLEFQNALMQHLARQKLGLDISRVIPSKTGATITEITAPDGARRWLRLLSWVEGRCFADVNPHTPELLEAVGEMCGKLAAALQSFEHSAAHRFLKWDLAQAAWTKDFLQKFDSEEQRVLAQYFFKLFENEALPLFPKLRQSVCYSDANDYNVLISHDPLHPTVPGVIDFGDAVFTHTINELAIAAAYAAMHKPDPLAAIAHVAKGFHSAFPITETEAQALFPLIGARLLISVTCSAQNLAENPGNEYLQISDRSAWALLEKLRAIHPELAQATIRHACGWEASPKRAAFEQWIEAATEQSKAKYVAQVVGEDANNGSNGLPITREAIKCRGQAPLPVGGWDGAAAWLDLSISSPQLGNQADIADAQRLHQRIAEAMAEAGATLGLGHYDEARPFYTTDAYAVEGNAGPQWRSVHLGLDLFMPPGTPVYAPLEGRVHSFQDNAQDRDYGPTIILEHYISDELTFYSLYGHLSRSSLKDLEKGQIIATGESFCEIGPIPENGNWSPHLHFQIMLNMLGREGDFPGVAFPETREIWKSICPDPWLLFTGKLSPKPAAAEPAEILNYRRNHLGKNLSVSYQKPLTILRGAGQYLYDDTGRRFLDTVNNVAHVGHEHPRVVRAGQRQMAVLNTNTRYLHKNIVQFTEALLATFPPELNVAFLVNSGSEANELALRLARNFTGQNDRIVLEAGYHGNTQGCVDISSYKFDGPGGSGAPPQVHVMPIPDTFRGLYRADDPAASTKYAAHIGSALEDIRVAGRAPAAFIGESVISCGGQIPLPAGYLAEVYRLVRAAGGLCIADEVQTGCGRHGQHFWAFEEHGVVPDIVTIGKPIGNGHPLAVVITTQAIAEAFANGMEYFNTFGGNPVSCAIGLEVLQVIRDEGLMENARETGAYLSSQLRDMAQRFPVIGDVRGPGLFLGFELIDDPEILVPAAAKADYLANRMRTLGILMSTDGPQHNVLKIKPPMLFGRRDANFLVDKLAQVLAEDFMKIDGY